MKGHMGLHASFYCRSMALLQLFLLELNVTFPFISNLGRHSVTVTWEINLFAIVTCMLEL